MGKGKFIVLEGIDGSGKSCQVKRLMSNLEAHGILCRADCEPTKRPVGALIRQGMCRDTPLDMRVIGALYVADRLDHLVNETDGVCKAIDSGLTVVSDRYYFSSYAYNSVDLDMDWVIQANSVSAGLLRPTVTVFLDVPVAIAMQRIRAGRVWTETFEEEARLCQTRELYFEAFRRMSDVENVVVLDGTGSEDEVAERVWSSVCPYFDTAGS